MTEADMTILVDSRERQPWDFSKYHNTEVATLKTGDYTIKGMENLICIERKKNATELFINLFRKKKAFSNEMKRMDAFKFKYIIIEQSLDDFMSPYNHRRVYQKHLQKSASGIILSYLLSLDVKSNIRVIWGGDRASTVARHIMEKVWNNFKDYKASGQEFDSED